MDEERRLCNLFWVDSTSRINHQCQGKIVGYDATYNRNKYLNPVVMMIGKNGHWKTMMFAIAILESKTCKHTCGC